MNIIIIGNQGYIGRELVKFLKKKKIQVTSFDKLTIKNLFNKKKITKIKNTNSILIHLGQPSNMNYKFLNKDIDLVDKLIALDFDHYIYISSAKIYLENKRNISDPKNSSFYKYDYNKLKLISERKFKSKKSTILRLTNVYGSNLKDKTLFFDILNQINKKNIFLKNASDKIDLIWIDDLLNLLFKVVKKKKWGVYDVGYGKQFSVLEIVKLFIKHSKKSNVNILSKKTKLSNIMNKLNIKKTNIAFNWKSKVDINTGIKIIIKNNINEKN